MPTSTPSPEQIHQLVTDTITNMITELAPITREATQAPLTGPFNMWDYRPADPRRAQAIIAIASLQELQTALDKSQENARDTDLAKVLLLLKAGSAWLKEYKAKTAATLGKTFNLPRKLHEVLTCNDIELLKFCLNRNLLYISQNIAVSAELLTLEIPHYSSWEQEPLGKLLLALLHAHYADRDEASIAFVDEQITSAQGSIELACSRQVPLGPNSTLSFLKELVIHINAQYEPHTIASILTTELLDYLQSKSAENDFSENVIAHAWVFVRARTQELKARSYLQITQLTLLNNFEKELTLASQSLDSATTGYNCHQNYRELLVAIGTSLRATLGDNCWDLLSIGHHSQLEDKELTKTEKLLEVLFHPLSLWLGSLIDNDSDGITLIPTALVGHSPLDRMTVHTLIATLYSLLPKGTAETQAMTRHHLQLALGDESTVAADGRTPFITECLMAILQRIGQQPADKKDEHAKSRIRLIRALVEFNKSLYIKPESAAFFTEELLAYLRPIINEQDFHTNIIQHTLGFVANGKIQETPAQDALVTFLTASPHHDASQLIESVLTKLNGSLAFSQTRLRKITSFGPLTPPMVSHGKVKNTLQKFCALMAALGESFNLYLEGGDWSMLPTIDITSAAFRALPRNEKLLIIMFHPLSLQASLQIGLQWSKVDVRNPLNNSGIKKATAHMLIAFLYAFSSELTPSNVQMILYHLKVALAELPSYKVLANNPLFSYISQLSNLIRDPRLESNIHASYKAKLLRILEGTQEEIGAKLVHNETENIFTRSTTKAQLKMTQEVTRCLIRSVKKLTTQAEIHSLFMANTLGTLDPSHKYANRQLSMLNIMTFCEQHWPLPSDCLVAVNDSLVRDTHAEIEKLEAKAARMRTEKQRLEAAIAANLTQLKTPPTQSSSSFFGALTAYFKSTPQQLQTDSEAKRGEINAIETQLEAIQTRKQALRQEELSKLNDKSGEKAAALHPAVKLRDRLREWDEALTEIPIVCKAIQARGLPPPSEQSSPPPGLPLQAAVSCTESSGSMAIDTRTSMLAQS